MKDSSTNVSKLKGSLITGKQSRQKWIQDNDQVCNLLPRQSVHPNRRNWGGNAMSCTGYAPRSGVILEILRIPSHWAPHLQFYTFPLSNQPTSRMITVGPQSSWSFVLPGTGSQTVQHLPLPPSSVLLPSSLHPHFRLWVTFTWTTKSFVAFCIHWTNTNHL